MINKKLTTIVIIIFFTLFTAGIAFSQSIEKIASEAAKEISKKVPKGSVIAVVNISSDYSKLSEDIVNQLTANLVNTDSFKIVSRSKIESDAVKRELIDFQRSGYVSEASIKRLGEFLGADTIILGTATREEKDYFKLSINAIHVESSTYQASLRKKFQYNPGGKVYDDYSVGDRFAMGLGNIFFGLGSISNKDPWGAVVCGIQFCGAMTAWAGALQLDDDRLYNENRDVGDKKRDKGKKILKTALYIYGGGTLLGFIVPFFHHKSDGVRVSGNESFPINLEFASFDDQDMNVFKTRQPVASYININVSYTMKF